MGKEYNFEAVKPEMAGGINFWSKELGMGAANIRTAIRNKSLNAVLVPLNEAKPEIQGYKITGQDILNWRANMRSGGSTAVKKIRDSYKFKTSVAITNAQAEAVNALLAANGFKFTLVKPDTQKKVKAEGDGEATPAVATTPAVAADAEEKPVQKSGFNIFGNR